MTRLPNDSLFDETYSHIQINSLAFRDSLTSWAGNLLRAKSSLPGYMDIGMASSTCHLQHRVCLNLEIVDAFIPRGGCGGDIMLGHPAPVMAPGDAVWYCCLCGDGPHADTSPACINCGSNKCRFCREEMAPVPAPTQ
ncbi:hypothetical protein P154DRAFT_537646 [Amniculicola lignicola CBS 123094]|uniref:Uncharacterized protein n=1 Tax=Amniculicola lignicola CBS 123094 TaxID=1392246 RepID=A0A6A5WGP9_9PLEO|nr:hypothetical protein P154DRAFT_537646 [Amniculicola lignicola CBS 123094]